MTDLLEIESQLAGSHENRRLSAESADGLAAQDDSQSAAQLDGGDLSVKSEENFYKSSKSNTLKKFYKKHFKAHKDSKGQTASGTEGGDGSYPAQLRTGASTASSMLDDACSEAMSELGRGSRASTRHESRDFDEQGSLQGTLKGMFKKSKKSKLIELDAIRLEMEMLHERCGAAENGLSTASHDVAVLTSQREQLQMEVSELTIELSSTRAKLEVCEAEQARGKELHAQVKGALQLAYTQNQELSKQVKSLEELCTAQQNSLEEGEEKYRQLTESHDALRHANLQSKAQLVTAQAQVSEMKAAREELLTEVASLEHQAAALQAEIDGRDTKCKELEAAQAEAAAQMEVMLGRLRELEGERQQLEARQQMMQEENLELSTELSGVTERRRQLEQLVSELQASKAELQASKAELQATNTELQTRLEAAGQAEAGLTARCDALVAERDAFSADLRASTDELGRLKEQQLKKQGSPLKWRFNGGSKGPDSSSGEGNGGSPVRGSSATGGAAALEGPGPMTLGRPAVGRALSRALTSEEEAHGQVAVQVSHPGTAPASSTGTPAAATATATGDATSPEAGAAAADGALQPMTSHSPDLSKAKGPLAAGRAASWRHPATAVRAGPAVKHEGATGALPAALGLEGGDAAAGVGKGTGAPRGGGGLTGSMEKSMWHQLFSCFQPPEVRAMGVV